MRRRGKYDYPFFNDMIFDLMKADETKATRIETDGTPMLLPLAAKGRNAEPLVSDGTDGSHRDAR